MKLKNIQEKDFIQDALELIDQNQVFNWFYYIGGRRENEETQMSMDSEFKPYSSFNSRKGIFSAIID